MDTQIVPQNRIAILDLLRGLAIINMVGFHACYDLVYIFGVQMPWYDALPGVIWQKYISLSFIIIAGVSFTLTKHIIRQTVRVIACAAIVSLVTVIFMPREVIIFGILHMLGLSMLVYLLLRSAFEVVPPWIGVIASLALAIVTRDLLPPPGFFSADYFPIIPYFFYFLLGTYLAHYLGKMPQRAKDIRIAPVNAIGRHSMIIYMIHQPLVLVVLEIYFAIITRI
ncbi:MAG: DUF1624 domain-containing protein [Clostridiales Family XIII bacterium]|nr:DUF1624 domain-containing protein [Clostridiales Family XIII bacterium]